MTPEATDGVVRIHASCVAVAGRAVLVTGRSGSGKSSLALKLIALGAELVADDQVLLRPKDGEVLATAPARLEGLIECHGLGILRLAHRETAPVALVADLDASGVVRMPQLRKRCIAERWFPLIAGRERPNLAYEITALLRNGRPPYFLDPEGPPDADAG